MPNIKRVDLMGEEHPYFLGMYALELIEEVSNVPALEFLSDIGSAMSAKKVNVLLWAGICNGYAAETGKTWDVTFEQFRIKIAGLSVVEAIDIVNRLSDTDDTASEDENPKDEKKRELKKAR